MENRLFIPADLNYSVAKTFFIILSLQLLFNALLDSFFFFTNSVYIYVLSEENKLRRLVIYLVSSKRLIKRTFNDLNKLDFVFIC